MPFRSFQKYCKECKVQLKLNNSRDIVRKNFCSHSCRAKFYEISKNGDILLMSTPEANAKKSRKGELNGRWIKNRSLIKTRPRYENYEWKRIVMDSQKYTCQECGKRGVYLEAHHKKKFSDFPELRFDLNNGITLCRICHDKTKRR